MVLRRLSVFLPLCVLMMSGLVFLAACSTGSYGPDFVAKDEPWRDSEDQACLSSGVVRQSQFIQSRSALGGPSVCGAAHPFEMSAAMGGRVAMRPPASLRCPMIPQVDRWVTEVVEPAARMHFGQSVVELTVAASYACRPINHIHGNKLSEHGYANAIDISKFTLTSGEVITVKGGWYGTEREQSFLRTVHNGACQNFSTVLGPDFDSNHRDHFHLDLARRGRDGLRQSCR